MKLRPLGYFAACMLFAFALLAPGILQASAGEAVPIAKIVVTGNTVLSAEKIASLTGPYLGKPVTLETLREVAEKITAEYKERGYILATAFVPEQKVVGGAVTIAVVEGRIGGVTIKGEHPYYSTEFIRKHFQPLMEEAAFSQDTLERALLVLNDYPKLKVTAMLQPGAEPGTSDLVVTADNSFPFHLTLDYNNFGSKFTGGRSRFGATLDLGNLITEGSLLSVRGITGERPSEFLYGRLYYTIPLNSLGTRLGIYYARGDFEVGKDFEDLDINGKGDQYGIMVSHPFIKRRLETLTAEFGIDFKDSRMYYFDDELTYRDKIRSVRAGLTYERTDSTGRTFGSLFVTQGLGHMLGAMENNDEMASRAGADNSFTKANINIIRLQRIIPMIYLMAKGSGQWGSDVLVASEQYYIGGHDSVRGFPSGERAGDSGFSLTAELRIAPIASNRDLLQIALFADTGTVYHKRTPSGEPSSADSHSLTGMGGGIRMNLPYDFNVRADVGFPIWPSESLNGHDTFIYLIVAKRF